MLILAKLMHYLSVNRISSLLACTTHERHDKRLKNCLNHAHKKLFKELSLIRFSISVFIFENHCTVFAVLPTGFRESVSIVVISPLQSIIQDQAAEVPSTGMSASDLKEKLDCL